MWRRDESVRPGASEGEPGPVVPASGHGSGPRGPGVVIGKQIVIRGELTGNEDLIIDGQVEGKIDVHENALTIGPNAKVRAQIFAKSIIVLGEITGNVTATEKVDIRDNGSIDGDIAAPRVAIAEGAHFRGSIDMQQHGARRKRAPSRIPVEIYIAAADPTRDYKKLESIQRSVAELLGSFGYEPEPESVSLAHSSWHWREWFRKNGRVEQEATEIFDGLKEALRRQQIDVAGADAFEKRATAAAELLKAFESYESAIARLGDVIVAKAVVDGKPRVVIETVSPQLARELERNPVLMRNPVAFFALLDSGNQLIPPAA